MNALGIRIIVRPDVENESGLFAMQRLIIRVFAWLALLAIIGCPGFCQSNPALETYFQQNIGLSAAEISAIRSGQPVAKALPSRTPAEVFLFGAVYIRATPESYFRYATNFDEIRQLPVYLELGVLSNPPQLSDLKDFTFDSGDIAALQDCKPGACAIQMPASSIETLQRSIDWSSPDRDKQVNQRLQQTALTRLLEYQREGDMVLGTYNDHSAPIEVARQFAYILSYHKTLLERLPDFYQYLLSYPDSRPANVENTFYWARVKFGLKPTLRIVQAVTFAGGPADPVAYAIADKQLYASHYFETALDLSFCVRGGEDPKQPGFYLVEILGSEQTGLTGLKGSIIRKVAVDRSVSNIQDTLMTVKNKLEGRH
jgi:hypothetical protein